MNRVEGEWLRPVDPGGVESLSQAIEWAHKTLAEHPLAVAVRIRESIQYWPGTSWIAGPGVATITREES